jgi:hypothetical protein
VAANFRQRPPEFKPGGNYFWDIEAGHLVATRRAGTFSDAPDRPLSVEISGLSRNGL